MGWADPSGLLTLSAGQVAFLSPFGGAVVLYLGGGDFEFTGESVGSGVRISFLSGFKVSHNSTMSTLRSLLPHLAGALPDMQGGPCSNEYGEAESVFFWTVAEEAISYAAGAKGVKQSTGVEMIINVYNRKGFKGVGFNVVDTTRPGKRRYPFRILGFEVHPWHLRGPKPRRKVPFWKWPHLDSDLFKSRGNPLQHWPWVR